MEATITLNSGCTLQESGIEEAFFDTAHQNFLCLRDGKVLTWTPQGDIEMVHDLGESHRKKGSMRQEVLYAKISLDKGFLALQYSETTLKVIDLQIPSRQWTLEIKSAYDNRIIDEGLIWSQHGGGSEDLIIVTARGAEMYKISSKRNQCKLSRVLNQGYDYHARFWYEPNYRVLLLASPINALDNTNSGGFLGFFTGSKKAEEQRKVLLQDLGDLALNGYFFRIDKDHIMPKLELPPPEKTPKWEVGPRVHESDVSLVALYGSVYCIVHMRQGPEYHLEGTLHLYRLTPNSSTHTHSLLLDYPAPQIPPLGTSLAFSVVDNLLLVHCKRIRVSAVFEITTSHDGSNGTSVKEETDDTRGVIKKNSKKSTSQKKTAREDPVTLQPLVPPTTIGRVDPAGVVNNSTPGEESYSHVKEGDVLVSHEQHLLQSKRSEKALQVADIYDDGEDDPRFCRWQIIAPHWVWDRKFRSLHALRPRIGTLLAAMSHRMPSSYAEFLLRRGGALRAPRPVYNELPGEARHRASLAVTAKRLLMHKIGESIEQAKNLTYLQALFTTLCAPYARLQQALEDSQQSDREGGAFADDGSTRTAKRRPSLFSSAPLQIPHHAPLEASSQTSLDNHDHNEGDNDGDNDGYGDGGSKAQNIGEESIVLAEEKVNSQFGRDDGDEAALGVLSNLEETFDEEVVGGELSPERLAFRMTDDTGDDDIEHIDDVNDDGLLGGLISTARETVINSPAMEGINNLVSEAAAKLQPYTEAVSEFIGVGYGSEDEKEGNLEPIHSLQIFLPDLSSVTSASINKVLRGSRSAAEGPTNSAGLRVSVSRDTCGMLAVTQSEMLSVLWFPLFLINTQRVPEDYACSALMLYIGALRATGASTLPCLCILLIRLLCSRGKFLEIARLMQLQYFLDCSEVALSSLEACDVLQQEDSHTYECHLSAIRTLQQAALDMLWRLHERNTVVRWLCSHGRVNEAMNLCYKRKGMWRRGLSPTTVSGCDFYNGALLLVESRNKRTSQTNSNGHNGEEKDAKREYSLSYARRLGTCFAVYRFLLSWEPKLLSLSNKGKSQLASMSSFPTGFRDRDELQLRGLFGFPVSEELIALVTGIPTD